MTDLEFRQQILDTKSASFCAAKWYNATIWLGSGQTTSCHHPLPHQVDLNEIEHNPKALHNTATKKKERQMMQSGERPAGCEYCWKIEDMGVNAVSDRVYKSKIYKLEDLTYAFNTPAEKDVDLKTLEIAFDRTCQFACSYCNPAFSSTWVKDIRNNGSYLGLESDGRNHFTHTHDSSQRYKFGEINPYVEAFFRWWDSDLHRTLTELRITGGEPLMSGYTWQLLDWFRENQGKSSTRLAINSNLGSREAVDQLLNKIEGLEVDIYTSMETTKHHAEYIRDGLEWQAWTRNLARLLEAVKYKRLRGVHIMCTINVLCLEHLPDLLTEIVRVKNLNGIDYPNFTLNILRFPSFQSPLVLPEYKRLQYRNQLQDWLDVHEHNRYLHQHELNHVRRLIEYLGRVDTPHSGAAEVSILERDFKRFYQQYDKRRNKDFVKTFPGLAEWYESIQV